MGRFPRLAAIVLVALMLAPSAPLAAADGTPPLPPLDAAKGIPPVAFGQDNQCVGTRFTQFVGGGPTAALRYVEKNGTKVFLLCDPALDSRAKQFIDEVNQAMVAFNGYTSFLDGQVTHRRDQYVPHQNLTYFSDDFQNRRIGGFGEWSTLDAVPDTASPWNRYSVVERFGERHAGFSFGDVGDPYYPQGADAALVTPQIDLTVNPLTDVVGAPRQYQEILFSTLAQDLTALRQEVAPQLSTDTNVNGIDTKIDTRTPFEQAISQTLTPYLATAEIYTSLAVSAWEHQNSAKLSLKERWNLAQGVDGVQVEVFEDHAPTADDLLRGAGEVIYPNPRNETPSSSPGSLNPPASCFAPPDVGVSGSTIVAGRCLFDAFNEIRSNPVMGAILNAACGGLPGGGYVNFGGNCDVNQPIGSSAASSLSTSSSFPAPPSDAQYTLTSQFRAANAQGFQSNANTRPNAFGGNSTDASWQTATFDLSRFVGHNVWLVFHAKTAFGTDDASFFRDRANFPDQRNWGFDLDYINVTGLAFPHHIRVKSLNEPSVFLPSERDPTVLERVVPPPAVGSPLNFTIANAGLYDENVTVTFTLTNPCEGCDLTFTEERSLRLFSGEVRNLVYPWPTNATAREGQVWNVSLALSYTDQGPGLGAPNPTGLTSNPQGYLFGTAGGPVSSPGTQTAPPGDTDLAQDIHVRLVRSVLPVALSKDDVHTIGVAPVVARRDEVRTITAHVANRGDTEETVDAEILLHTAEGGDVAQFIESNVTVPLGTLEPGEARDAKWLVRPDAPGVFNVTIIARDALGPGRPVLGSDYRTLYVGRTAGLVCFDDLAAARDCTASWNVTRPQEFLGRQTTASWLSPDGSLWVGGDHGLLYRLAPDLTTNTERTVLPTHVVPPPITGSTCVDGRVEPTASGTTTVANDTQLRWLTATGAYNPKVGAGRTFVGGTDWTAFVLDDLSEANVSIPIETVLEAAPWAIKSSTVHVNEIDPASPTLPCPPRALEGERDTFGNGSTASRLSWHKPALNGSADVTAYRIYRSAKSGEETLLKQLDNGSTTDFTDWNPGTAARYFYKVSAVTANGESLLSNEAAAPDIAPDAPTGLNVTVGATYVSLAWQAPGHVNRSTIGDYAILRGTTTDNEVEVARTGGANTSFVDRSVIGATYFYRVLATNGGGDGNESTEVGATPWRPDLRALWMSPDMNELWAGAEGGLLFHRNTTKNADGSANVSWRTDENWTVRIFANQDLTSIWGTDASNVYFAARDGHLAHWNGKNLSDLTPKFRKLRALATCPAGCDDIVALAGVPSSNTSRANGFTLYALLTDGWVVKQDAGSDTWVLAAGLRGLDGRLYHRVLTASSSRASALAFSPRGEMMIGYTNGTIERCESCDGGSAPAHRTRFQIPVWAPITAMTFTAEGIAAVASDGAVLEYAKRVAFPNQGDWDPNATLAPTNTQAWYTNYDLAATGATVIPGSLRGEIVSPDADPFAVGSAAGAGAVCETPPANQYTPNGCVVTGIDSSTLKSFDRLVLRFNHRFAHGARQYLEPGNLYSAFDSPGEVRLVFARSPDVLQPTLSPPPPVLATCPLQIGSVSQAQAAGLSQGQGTGIGGGMGLQQQKTDCPFVTQTLKTFSQPTSADGWVTENLSFTGALDEQAYSGLRLVGIEFFAPAPGTYSGGSSGKADPHPEADVAEWAVQSVDLWAAQGNAFRTLLHWDGRPATAVGRWSGGEAFPVDVNRALDEGSMPSNPANPLFTQVTSNSLVRTQQVPAFILAPHLFNAFAGGMVPVQGGGSAKGASTARKDGTSLWHLANETEVPTWVANHGSGGKDVLHKIDTDLGLNEYNSTLASPMIDLHDATDPVLAIDTAYWLRTTHYTVTDPSKKPHDCTAPVDLAQVSVERLQSDGTWSTPSLIHPVGGYPAQGTNGGIDEPTCAAVEATTNHVTDGFLDASYSDGFWGATSPKQVDNTVSALLAASSYRTVRFALNDQRLPYSPGGNVVRFLFTLRDGSGVNINGVPNPLYDGWYVRNLRVESERALGSDLALESVTPEVGYDWKNIGFGNGTVVPINVTVKNDGRFDVFGSQVDLLVYGVDPVTNFAVRVPCAPRECPDLVAKDDTVLAAGKNRSVTLYWHVPTGDNGLYFLVAKAKTLVDDDISNNALSLGSAAIPLHVSSHPAVRVRVVATPQDASREVLRTLDVVVDNVGNVPLANLAIDRVITRINGRAPPRVDRFTVCASGFASATCGAQGLAEGTSASVATLGPVAGASALLWIAACTPGDLAQGLACGDGEGNYLVRAVLTDASGRLPLTAGETFVGAFTTAFFDNVEGPPIGNAFHGKYGGDLTNWTTSGTLGFQSVHSRVFGDPDFDRVPANANASLVTPAVDLSSVSNAKLLFYQKYRFEPGYDGGVVEVSTDGGKNWTRMTPDPTPGQPRGYNSTSISAASPLSASHDPTAPAYGFTGNSSLVPGNRDGYYLTTFDLGRVPSLIAKDSPFASFPIQREGNGNIHYEPQTGNGRTFYPDFRRAYNGSVDNTTVLPDYATDPSWFGGTTGIDKGGFWQRDVLSHRQPDVHAAATGAQFFWSGSPAMEDDRLNASNSEMDIRVNTSAIASNRHVELSWWEWLPMGANDRLETRKSDGSGLKRLDADSTYIIGEPSDDPGSAGSTVVSWRENLGTKTLITDRQGSWRHIVTDVTDRFQRDRAAGKDGSMNLSFVFSPVHYESASKSYVEYLRAYTDLGWVVDDVNALSYRLDHGRKIYDPAPILSWSRLLTNARTNGTGEDANGNPAGIVHTFKCLVSQDDISHPCQMQSDWKRDHDDNANDPNHLIGAGRTWALVTADALAGIPNAANLSFDGWHTLDLNDANLFPDQRLLDHRNGTTLPDGSDSRVFYNGRLDPKNIVFADAQNGTRDQRLVTPTVDLSRISGASAHLSFWQLYAFHHTGVPSSDWQASGQFAEGAAVEIQAYDPDRGVWGAWKELYPDPSNMTFAGMGGYTDATLLVDSKRSDSNIEVFYFDAPFESHADPKNGTALAYLWSGKSSARCDKEMFEELRCNGNGWVRDTFDLSPFIGRLVRIGFHSFTDPSLAKYRATDHPLADANVPGGWYIDDISITGDLLLGKPAQFRFRAATDASENHGFWSIDDVAVTGNQYRRNLGVFVDDAATGGSPGTTVDVNATLRNLGDLVRRNLAVEIRETTSLAGAAGLVFDATPSVGTFVLGTDIDHPSARVEGIDLPPRATTPVHFRVTIPAAAVADGAPRSYVLRVLEKNDFTGAYEPVTDNEIPGFLSTSRLLRVEKLAHVAFANLTLSPTEVSPGESTTVRLPLVNDGVASVRLVGATCVAQRSSGFTPADHAAGAADVETLGAREPCTALSVPANLAPGEHANATWTFVPKARGTYRLSVSFNATNGGDPVGPASPLTVRLRSGVKPVFFRDDLETRGNLTRWHTGAGGAQLWKTETEHTHSGATAWEAGVTDTEFASGSSYESTGVAGTTGPTYTLLSPPIDLHNASGDAAYLRFWHLVRLARGDGADVHVQVLRDETQPALDSSWSPQVPGAGCKLFPSTANYTYGVQSLWIPLSGTVNVTADSNAALVQRQENKGLASPTVVTSNDPAFKDIIYPPDSKNPVEHASDIAAKVFYGGFTDTWVPAEFDLAKSECGGVPLLGSTVRFVFSLYSGTGQSSAEWFKRGPGQGWFIDDLSLTSYNASFAPVVQRFHLLDNATKEFPFAVANGATHDDTYDFALLPDETNAPAGSVAPPATTAVAAGGRASPAIKVNLPRAPELLPAIYNAKVRLTSRSDRNLVRDALVTLDFEPRRWPDLKVTVEPPTHPLEAGVQTLLPIVVANNGLVTAPPTEIKVTDTWTAPDGVTKVTEVKCLFNVTCATPGPLPSLLESPEESTTIVVLPWTPNPDQHGLHTLRIEADPNHLIDEYTRLDDVVTLTFNVGALHEPDLAVSDKGISVTNAFGASIRAVSDGDLTRYDVEQGDLVTLAVVVKNIGTDVATNVDVRAFIGPLSLPPKTLQVIPAGSQADVTFTWVAQKGEWPLAFVAHTAQVELDDTNNRVPTGGAIVLAVRGFDVTATLAGVPADVRPGSVFNATLTLENTGTSGQELALLPQVPADWTVAFDSANVFLAKGRSGKDALATTARVTVGAHALAGAQTVGVKVVSRDNPTKSVAAAGATRVAAVYGATFVAPASAIQPGRIGVPIVITNLGNSPAPMLLSPKLPAGWEAEGALPASISVPPFGSTKGTLALVSPTSLPVGAVALPLTLTLADGSTVSATSHLTVLEKRVVAFVAPSETPDAGADKLVYDVTATNVGNARAVFTVLVGGLAGGWSAEVAPSQGDLSPGESMKLALTLALPANVTGGTYDVKLSAHFTGEQPGAASAKESTGILHVKILKPDVAVHDFGVSPRLGLSSGTRLSAKVPLENIGTSPATNVSLDLFVDDVFISEVRLASLAPGERREVTLNWTALGGEHTLTVVADPFHATLDADRDNNAVAKAITVAGPQEKVTGLPAAARVPGPDGSITLIMVAFAAVALAGTVRRRTRRGG